MNFDDRALAVLDVLATALQVDLGGARPDTPLQAFSVEQADWIVVLDALDAAFPGSVAGFTDAVAEKCVTLGDLVERVEVSF